MAVLGRSGTLLGIMAFGLITGCSTGNAPGPRPPEGTGGRSGSGGTTPAPGRGGSSGSGASPATGGSGGNAGADASTAGTGGGGGSNGTTDGGPTIGPDVNTPS